MQRHLNILYKGHSSPCTGFQTYESRAMVQQLGIFSWEVEVVPYKGYIGMCGPKGYGFSTVFGHK